MDELLMKELLQDIRDDLKEVKNTQKDMQQDISHMKEDVKLHVYRTDLAEENIEHLREESREGFKQVYKDLEPVKRHINMVKGVGIFLGVTLTILGILNYLHII